MNPSVKWYQKTWVVVLFLFFFFPVGLFLMWKYSSWPKIVKWVVTGFFAIMVLGGALNGDSSKSSTPGPQATQTPQVQISAEPSKAVEPTKKSEPTKTSIVATSTQAPSESVSQKNAVKKAQSYLNYSAFSHDGLVAQLEFEKFSHADAVYGADNSGANWNEQAAKKAKSYMEYSAFSRGSLIDQLKYEKFTQAQAEFGANAVGL